jgi:glycerophosphoryl diester phosphodiesterase
MKAMADKSAKFESRVPVHIALFSATAFALCPVTLGGAELEGRAVLPANTSHAGQPVGGFSAVINNGDGSFDAVTSGDFGPGEPRDFHIRVYTLRADFKTAKGGTGKISIEGFVELSDPEQQIPFAITQHFTPQRILTAADFDIESMQRAPDGTFWFGDGVGPFLIHTDKTGKVLERPIELPDPDKSETKIRTARNPNLEEASAVRIMNAFCFDARSHGNKKKTLVFSPDHTLLDDCNPKTFLADRAHPPAGSGLACASSEIFNVDVLRRAGFEVIPYTVNDKKRMLELMRLKVNGIISDRPDLLRQAIEEFDADGDGKPGDFLDPDGLIDPNKFSAQAHRGGRNLRPENTLPSMEVGLDCLINTLETDCGITKDGVAVLSHDPFLPPEKWQRTDGTHDGAQQVLIKDRTLDDLQTNFVGDLLLSDRPHQRKEGNLSPVAQAFFKEESKQKSKTYSIYTIPALEQLFRFVKFYANFYHTGEGRNMPDAAKRWKNAAKVRFNIETKTNPRSDSDKKTFAQGKIAFRDRTIDPDSFAKQVADTIVNNDMTDRADVQSFDFRTLRYVHEHYPRIRTVFLFGDFPIYRDQNNPDSEDGTNLQDENGANTPWLAGLIWPYRDTKLNQRCRATAGLNGLALRSDKKHLFAVLGQPLIDGESQAVLICEFDLASKQFTDKHYIYQIAKDSYVGDLAVTDPNRGFVIEADLSRDSNGSKTIYEINFDSSQNRVPKKRTLELVQPADRSFSFSDIGSLVQLDHDRFVIVNKNRRNYFAPRQGAVQSEDTEFILIRIPSGATPEKK